MRRPAQLWRLLLFAITVTLSVLSSISIIIVDAAPLTVASSRNEQCWNNGDFLGDCYGWGRCDQIAPSENDYGTYGSNVTRYRCACFIFGLRRFEYDGTNSMSPKLEFPSCQYHLYQASTIQSWFAPVSIIMGLVDWFVTGVSGVITYRLYRAGKLGYNLSTVAVVGCILIPNFFQAFFYFLTAARHDGYLVKGDPAPFTGHERSTKPWAEKVVHFLTAVLPNTFLLTAYNLMFLFWRRITAKTFQPNVKFLAGTHMKLVWAFGIAFAAMAVSTEFIDDMIPFYILFFMLWQLVLAIVIFIYGGRARSVLMPRIAPIGTAPPATAAKTPMSPSPMGSPHGALSPTPTTTTLPLLVSSSPVAAHTAPQPPVTGAAHAHTGQGQAQQSHHHMIQQYHYHQQLHIANNTRKFALASSLVALGQFANWAWVGLNANDGSALIAITGSFIGGGLSALLCLFLVVSFNPYGHAASPVHTNHPAGAPSSHGHGGGKHDNHDNDNKSSVAPQQQPLSPPHGSFFKPATPLDKQSMNKYVLVDHSEVHSTNNDGVLMLPVRTIAAPPLPVPGGTLPASSSFSPNNPNNAHNTADALSAPATSNIAANTNTQTNTTTATELVDEPPASPLPPPTTAW